MRYLYSVIRFVPDPVSGESLNLGVIAGSDDTGEWELRRGDISKRLRLFDTRRVLPHVLAYVEELARAIDDYGAAVDEDLPAAVEVSEAWLKDIARGAQNMVQFSMPAPIDAESLDEVLGVALEQFVVPVDGEAGAERGLNKRSAVTATRRAYLDRGLRDGQHFQQRAAVTGPAQRHEAFDLAVYNGHVLQLVQGWSFQAALEDNLSRRVRAWAWMVRGLRDQGGFATLGVRKVEVLSDVDIEAVYIPPAAGGGSTVLDEALSAFEELRVKAVPIDDASAVAARASELLGKQARV